MQEESKISETISGHNIEPPNRQNIVSYINNMRKKEEKKKKSTDIVTE